MQDTFDTFASNLTIPGKGAAFVAGDDTPASADQDKLWLKQDATSCKPLGWYYYNTTNSAWEEISFVPVGSVQAYSSATPPSGWLACDGAAVSRTTYSDLYSVTGDAYGSGDGSTTFNVPDLRGRAAIGTGTGTGLTARTLGDSSGAETHTLTESEMPAHTHTVATQQWWGSGNDGAGYLHKSGTGENSGSTGGGSAHNNMQPYLALAYIIKA